MSKSTRHISSQFELGYYEPGHGTKGTKRCFDVCDEDTEDILKELYKKLKEDGTNAVVL